jgi:tetratricopeptide (TPR) repeat protein
LAQTGPDRYEPDYALSLSNYAALLSEVGQSERGLEQSREALEIRWRLAQTGPDRYEPDYALSLNNYAKHLSEVGQSEAALEHARQAWEILRRLAQTRPDRYEPDYALSLDNYANRLSEVGQSEAALEHARQSSGLYHLLAERRPELFDYDVINTGCLMQSLSWVCGRTAIDCAVPDPDAIPPTIRPHRRPELQLHAAFVRGCLAVDEDSRRDAFKRVQSAWGALTVRGKTATRKYWLCAAAWCATHAPDALDALDWQTQWQSFMTQRKGHIPWWMLEVARRLSFQWPQ